MTSHEKPVANTADRLSVFLIGILLLAGAALFSNSAIETTLLGKADGKLEWGPTLFRGMLAVHGIALLAWSYFAMRPRPSRPTALLDDHREVPGAYLWLALLCVIGLALRLYELGTCLWIDEMFTLVDFLRKPLPQIVTMFPSQNQHMLYSVLGRICVVLGGESAATARLPAALFGAASIPALYFLGRRMIGSREALLACAVMTFSYHHVWFSQSARGYSGLLFFTILAAWLWLEAVRHGTPRWWISYAICVALGMWIHMTMLFVLAAHGIAWLGLVTTRHKRVSGMAPGTIDPAFTWKAWLAWIFSGTLTLQLHALALPEFFRSALHEHSPDSEWLNPFWVIWESLERLGDGGIGGLALIVGAIVMLVGWLALWKRDWQSAVVAIVPPLLGAGTMIALKHNLWPRFFFFCMGFFILIAVHGGMTMLRLVFTALMERNSALRYATTVGTIGCLLVAAASATTLPRCYDPPKQDYWGARDYVEKEMRPGDAKVAVGLAGIAFQNYFAPDWRFVQTRAELDEFRQKHDRVWLVYTLPIELRSRWGDLAEAIDANFKEVKTFYGTLGGGEVVVCTSDQNK